MPASISEYTPQLVRDEGAARRGRAAWAAWGLTVAFAASLVALIVLAPLARSRGYLLLSEVFYQFFHAVCHQMPERSFQIAGYPLAVCARCTGLYVGGLLGVAAYPLARPLTRTDAPERVWLLLAVLPTTVDFALGFFGIWENTHWSRFLTALLAGARAGFFLRPGVVGCGPRESRGPRGFWPPGLLGV